MSFLPCVLVPVSFSAYMLRDPIIRVVRVFLQRFLNSFVVGLQDHPTNMPAQHGRKAMRSRPTDD